MIMRLFGLYAIYQNQEFELVEHSESRWKIPGDTEYWLLTDNPGAAALGFGEVRPGRSIESRRKICLLPSGRTHTLHTRDLNLKPIR